MQIAILFIIGLFLKQTEGFLLPIISQKIIVSNLESIITLRALTSSIFENINKEIDLERAVLQVLPMHYSINSYVYLSIILTFLYSQLYFYDKLNYNRFEKIEQFSKDKKIIKNILFILVLVFLKDTQSCT